MESKIRSKIFSKIESKILPYTTVYLYGILESIVAIKIPIKKTSKTEKENFIIYYNVQSAKTSSSSFSGVSSFSGNSSLHVFELPEKSLNAVGKVFILHNLINNNHFIL